MPALYQDNKDIPEDMLLGSLLFYNLTSMTISENELLDIFNNNNLSQQYVRKISPADAFRRATSSIKNEKVVYTDDNGDQFDGRINVDEVVNDNMYVKRIVGVRVLNDQKEEVSYTQLGSITYDRANDCCATYLEPTSTHYVANISFLFTQVETRYMAWSTYHNHDTIKNIINRIVDSMHPIALMPTGICKFIPKISKDTLYALNGVINDLSQFSDNGIDENTVEIIPILDTQEHRKLVNKVYEDEIQESLLSYSMELSEILKQKQKLSPRQASTYIEKYKELMAKVKDYESLLGTYQENINFQLKNALKFIDDNVDK